MKGCTPPWYTTRGGKVCMAGRLGRGGGGCPGDRGGNGTRGREQHREDTRGRGDGAAGFTATGCSSGHIHKRRFPRASSGGSL